MASMQIEMRLEQGIVTGLHIPAHSSPATASAISETLRQLLPEVFALYLKTTNFLWHMSGAYFRDYHLLLDEQAEEILAMTDPISERASMIGDTTLRSIGDMAQYRRLLDHIEIPATPNRMFEELLADNRFLVELMRSAHDVCEESGDVVTAGLLEVWIDEAERRTWFLLEPLQSRN